MPAREENKTKQNKTKQNKTKQNKTKQNTPLVSSCRYVCPEPVLANVWVLAENGANEPVF
jgi:hypothetical protein